MLAPESSPAPLDPTRVGVDRPLLISQLLAVIFQLFFKMAFHPQVLLRIHISMRIVLSKYQCISEQVYEKEDQKTPSYSSFKTW